MNICSEGIFFASNWVRYNSWEGHLAVCHASMRWYYENRIAWPAIEPPRCPNRLVSFHPPVTVNTCGAPTPDWLWLHISCWAMSVLHITMAPVQSGCGAPHVFTVTGGWKLTNLFLDTLEAHCRSSNSVLISISLIDAVQTAKLTLSWNYISLSFDAKKSSEQIFIPSMWAFPLRNKPGIFPEQGKFCTWQAAS